MADFLQRLGRGLTGFGQGVQDPASFSRLRQQQQQFEARQDQARNEVRSALAQQVLQSLPEGHPAREKATAVLEEQGLGFAAEAFQPQAPAPEQVTLRPGDVLGQTTIGPEGRVQFEEIARGREPRERGPLVQVGGRAEPTFTDKIVQEEVGKVINRGLAARGVSADFERLGDLISSEEVQTGRLARPITAMQGLFDEIGVDLNTVAKRIGFKGNLGDLAKKEEFDELTKNALIAKFEDFKGNLNQKEVEIAQDSVADIGKSEEANIESIAMSIAAARLARQRGLDALRGGLTPAEARGILFSAAGDDSTELIELQKQISQELRAKRGLPPSGSPAIQGSPDTNQVEQSARQAQPTQLPPDAPQGSTPITLPSGKRAYKTPDGRWMIEE